MACTFLGRRGVSDSAELLSDELNACISPKYFTSSIVAGMRYEPGGQIGRRGRSV